jgi:hypothetical protein
MKICPKKRTSLATTGDPEQDARNRLQFLRESSTGGVVYECSGRIPYSRHRKRDRISYPCL